MTRRTVTECSHGRMVVGMKVAGRLESRTVVVFIEQPRERSEKASGKMVTEFAGWVPHRLLAAPHLKPPRTRLPLQQQQLMPLPSPRPIALPSNNSGMRIVEFDG
ncbi:hypothetical protein FOZ63_019883 [Perkinsus olseni]|uniref:Uncharacterized protein n=1 Tax=Perkinsus olseni TaxID=32597 RepID=A0A7J6U7D7_PEROL|nr:hypothetical protein FOZ63_019883 [Perkinsus olseni]